MISGLGEAGVAALLRVVAIARSDQDRSGNEREPPPTVGGSKPRHFEGGLGGLSWNRTRKDLIETEMFNVAIVSLPVSHQDRAKRFSLAFCW